jgi:uncharacterized protein (TIGR02145 family)
MRYAVITFLLLSVISIIGCDDESDVVVSEQVTIEGKAYHAVKIGNQIWTTSNYEGPGGVHYDDINSKPAYGKYYSKAELDGIVVPEGWRIPTLEDYKKLAEFYGISAPSKAAEGDAIKVLISTTQWNHVTGTNSSGFNAFPGGYIFGDANPIGGDIAEFWTIEGYTFSIQEAGENLSSLRIALYDSNSSPSYRFNVRFVKTNP